MSSNADENVTKFIVTVGAFFPRPKFGENEEALTHWMALMVSMLGGYSDEILTEAAATIIRTRDPAEKGGSMFPKPKECIEACDNAKARKELAQAPLLETAAKIKERQEKDPHAAWRKDRVALAVDLCRTPLGQRAGREGWILQLYDFCRNYARVPNAAGEIEKLISDARAYHEMVERLRGEAGTDTVVTALVRLGDTVLGRRQEIFEMTQKPETKDEAEAREALQAALLADPAIRERLAAEQKARQRVRDEAEKQSA